MPAGARPASARIWRNVVSSITMFTNGLAIGCVPAFGVVAMAAWPARKIRTNASYRRCPAVRGNRMVGSVVTELGGPGGDIGVELVLTHEIEDGDDLGGGDRVTTDHRHIQLGTVDDDVGVAMLDRGVTVVDGRRRCRRWPRSSRRDRSKSVNDNCSAWSSNNGKNSSNPCRTRGLA